MISSLSHRLFRSIILNFQIYGNFLVISVVNYLVSSLCCNQSIHCVSFQASKIYFNGSQSIFLMFHVWLKRIYGHSVKYSVSIWSSLFIVNENFHTFAFVFLLVLSITEKGVLHQLSVSISLLLIVSVNFGFIHLNL